MGFVDEYLTDGEDLILDLKPHWWVFSLPAFILAGLVIALIIVSGTWYFGQAVGIATLGVAGWVGWVYRQWANTHFVVTSRRVIYRSGVISKSGIEIPLDRISNVLFHQRLFERALGAGDLTIESAGESGQQKFANVRKPDAVQNEINYAIEAQRTNRMTPQSVSGDSIPVQIEKLAELRDSGAITQAEYAASKADLLKKLS